jgi:hypothetical protein
MILAAVVASGSVLVPIMQAFSNNGYWFLSGAGVPAILALYAAAGLLAYLAMLAVAVALLSIVNDGHRSRSIRILAGVLPVGAAVAGVSGVAMAAILHYEVRPRTFTLVGIVIAAVVIAAITAARLLTTRLHLTREQAEPM